MLGNEAGGPDVLQPGAPSFVFHWVHWVNPHVAPGIFCAGFRKGVCCCRGVNPHVAPSMAAGSVAAPRQASGHPVISNERRIVAGISSFAFQVGSCRSLHIDFLTITPLVQNHSACRSAAIVPLQTAVPIRLTSSCLSALTSISGKKCQRGQRGTRCFTKRAGFVSQEPICF